MGIITERIVHRLGSKIIGILAIAVVITATVFAARYIASYPQIVRSAYLKNPILLSKALYYRVLPGGGKSAEYVAGQVLKRTTRDEKHLQLLFLDKTPRTDTAIRERYFKLLSKPKIVSDEELFWQYQKKGRIALIEYRTGRIVYDCIEGEQLVPPFAFKPARPEPLNKTDDSDAYDSFKAEQLISNSSIQELKQLEKIKLTTASDAKAFELEYESRIRDSLRSMGFSDSQIRQFIDEARKTLDAQNLHSDKTILLPAYAKKVRFEGHPALLLIYGWEYRSFADMPVDDPHAVITPGHRAVLFLSEKDATLLYALRCR